MKLNGLCRDCLFIDRKADCTNLVVAGLDLNCGITHRDHSELALNESKLKESDLDAALRNMFAVQMRLGLFDGDPETLRYGHLGVNDVCTEAHQTLALEAALQGIVLLKNDKNALPLSAKHIHSLAVLGPSASDGENRMLGNYAGWFPHTLTNGIILQCFENTSHTSRYLSNLFPQFQVQQLKEQLTGLSVAVIMHDPHPKGMMHSGKSNSI